jgi:hypothetical protein
LFGILALLRQYFGGLRFLVGFIVGLHELDGRLQRDLAGHLPHDGLQRADLLVGDLEQGGHAHVSPPATR